jgi:hypothetical protein
MSSPNNNNNIEVGMVKDTSREGRLSFRNFAEHQMRSEFKREAIQKCDLQLRAFSDCAKVEGVMVVFRCREFKKAVDECMTVYNSSERFELYKKEHDEDLQKRTIQSKN